MAKSYWNHALVWSALAGALAGCGTVPDQPAPVSPPLAEPTSNAQNGGNKPALQLEPPSRTGNADSYVVYGRRYRVKETSEGYREQGIASWYGKDFHGRKTSSGPRYNMFDLTAAHKSLPIPAYVRVSNLANGRDVVVKVTDRGPFVGNRIIDLSYTAAERLGMLGKGTAQVEVTALEPYQVLPKLAARRAEATQQLADHQPRRMSGLDASAIPPVREEPNRPAKPEVSRPELAAMRAETPQQPDYPAQAVVRAEVPKQPDRPAQPAAKTESSAPRLAFAEPRLPETPAVAVRAETPQQSDRPTQPAAKTESSAPQLARVELPRPEALVLDVPAPRQAAEPESAMKQNSTVARSQTGSPITAEHHGSRWSGPHSGRPARETRKESHSFKRLVARPLREAGALKPLAMRLAGAKPNRSRSASD